ncbi:MAG: hypothetical protein ACRD0P_38305, partial [Stackebrandtia sp.]
GYQLNRRPVGLILRSRQEWPWTSAYTVFGSIESDLAATVDRLRHMTYASVSLGPFGLAPTVRRRAERGDLSVSPVGGSAIIAGLCRQAGRGAMAGRPLDPMDGPPLSARGDAVPARQVGGTVLLHVPFANPDTGYAWGYGPGLDHLFASAARKLVVSYDVAVAIPPALPNSFVIPPDGITELVHLPYGAFPSSSWPLYRTAAPFLAEYVRRSQDPTWTRDLPSSPVDLLNEHLTGRDKTAMVLRVCPQSRQLARIAGLS